MDEQTDILGTAAVKREFKAHIHALPHNYLT